MKCKKASKLVLLSLCIIFSSCSTGSGTDQLEEGKQDKIITITTIDGITAPVYGMSPVTTITETAQYTGSVTWSNSPIVFGPTTKYTATISLTEKPGYTVNGIPANFFSVSGSESVTNEKNSGVITVVFAATGSSPGEYKIIFNANGGSGTMPPVVGKEGETVILSTNVFTRTNYSFEGWSTIANALGTVFPPAASVTIGNENITLYAIWKNTVVDNLDPKSMEMILLLNTGPDGYLKGNNDGEYIQETSESTGFPHKLSPFSIGKYEVSYELWYTVLSWAKNNGYNIANVGSEGYFEPTGAAPTTHLLPATNMNWRDAIVWCNALSEMLGKTPFYYIDAAYTIPLKESTSIQSMNNSSGSEDNPYINWLANGYRLPTEGEWQYAASCGGIYPFNHASGSDESFEYSEEDPVDIDGDGIIRYFDDVAWYALNSTGHIYGIDDVGIIPDFHPHEIGTKAANIFGLHDMSGNVNEWCFDGSNGVYPANAVNYRGNTLNPRVLRGGSYSAWDRYIRVGEDGSSSPFFKYDYTGLRIVQNH